MPDPPPEKRTTSPSGTRRRLAAAGVGYAELCCRTNYSFLDGASHPDELVERAAELGYRALAVTDRSSLAGIVRAHVAARDCGLDLICGARLDLLDAPPVLLWAPDRAGYAQLSRLLTRGRRRAPKGECRLSFNDLAGDADRLLAGVLLDPLVTAAGDEAAGELDRFAELFGDRGWALAGLYRGPDDRRRLSRCRQLATAARLPLAATNNVVYHVPGRQVLGDVLTAIAAGRPVAELGARLRPNAERHLKSPQAMTSLFADCPDAIAATVEIAERCSFSLDELKYEYPEELCPAGQTSKEFLAELTWAGAARRYPDGVPGKVRGLVEHELALIEELSYEPYFLTVWDLVGFARRRGILCQGRGSAANSAVCYCLGITAVDPERIDVLFERFVSRERDEAPDIDVDFEHERREEVLQYVYRKYGRDRAGMTAEVITYRPRSAIRDVGKALGLSLDRVDRLARLVGGVRDDERFAARVREAGIDPVSDIGSRLVRLVTEIQGFPRHLSQHVGGMVITRGSLGELVPIENAAMPDRTVIQWDKNDLDALGILKVDCLGLGMLSAIRKALNLVGTAHRPLPTASRSTISSPNDLLASIPAEDPAIYEMICEADTVGVFQIESRAQMSMLPRLKPRCFYDLVIEVAIVRPGPIQGDMVHPYLRRRAGTEAVEYPDEAVRRVLEKTLGVPIFQEQAMRLAVVAAGFTPGEADQLRRAMGAWRRPGVIDRFRERFFDGMRHNGYSDEFADRLFRQIRGFGEYGFPESHAASFALLVYVSAWLKRYHPAAFTAALLNSQPMGFYAPAQLVADARRHGVEVRPVDVNASEWDCTLERAEGSEPWTAGSEQADGIAERSTEDPERRTGSGQPTLPAAHCPSPALRLGLRMIRGLSESIAKRVLAARPVRSVDELARRAGLGRAALSRLARADAFGSIGLSRRQSLWQALPGHSSGPLWEGRDEPEPPVRLEPMSDRDEVVADYRSQGLSLKGHPLGFLRDRLTELDVTPAARLEAIAHGERVTVAGMVLLRQRPSSARGITFVTLEDETGLVNLIVRQETWERHRRVAHTARVMLATGTLQRQAGVIHVLVGRLADLSGQFGGVPAGSRNFR